MSAPMWKVPLNGGAATTGGTTGSIGCSPAGGVVGISPPGAGISPLGAKPPTGVASPLPGVLLGVPMGACVPGMGWLGCIPVPAGVIALGAAAFGAVPLSTLPLPAPLPAGVPASEPQPSEAIPTPTNNQARPALMRLMPPLTLPPLTMVSAHDVEVDIRRDRPRAYRYCKTSHYARHPLRQYPFRAYR